MRKVVQLTPFGDGLDPNYWPHLGFTFFWSAVQFLQLFNWLSSWCKTCLMTFSNWCVPLTNSVSCCCNQLLANVRIAAVLCAEFSSFVWFVNILDFPEFFANQIKFTYSQLIVCLFRVKFFWNSCIGLYFHCYYVR